MTPLIRVASRAVPLLTALWLGLPVAAAPPSPSAPAASGVKVEQGWLRPTVPGQQGTGGYMKLTAIESKRLVSASSPLAGVAEIHDVKMDGDVMKMRPLGGPLELPAGKAVELKPGGLHLMLMDLRQPLAAGTSVAITLTLRDGLGVETRQEVKLPVAAVAPAGGAAATEGHKH